MSILLYYTDREMFQYVQYFENDTIFHCITTDSIINIMH